MATRYSFSAVVFDMDGTLVDSTGIKTWAFGKVYEEYGQDIADAMVSYHLNHQGISRFEKFRYFQEKILGEPYTENIGEALSKQFNQMVVNAVVQAPYIEGAQEFLDKHHKYLPLFVASATPEEELREIVSLRGMGKYFRGVYGAPATKGEILRRIAVENDWNPAELLMVGDAASDYEGAHSAGTSFVAMCEGECPSFFDNVKIRLPDLTELECVVHGPN